MIRPRLTAAVAEVVGRTAVTPEEEATVATETAPAVEATLHLHRLGRPTHLMMVEMVKMIAAARVPAVLTPAAAADD